MDEKDPRIRAFLRHAASLVALQRGLNSASREQLKSLAENIQLSPDEFEWALGELNRSGELPSALTRYEQAFLDYLVRKFEKLPHAILPLKVENKAVIAANRKFQISAVRAHQLIDRACEATKVRGISKSDAESFVEDVIVQQVGDSTQIDRSARERMQELGRQWGIEREHVDVLLDQTIRDNVVMHRRRRRTRWTYTLGSVAVLGAALLATKIVADRRASTGNEPILPAAMDSQPMESLPSWWPTKWFRENQTRIMSVAAIESAFDHLKQGNAGDRADIYKQLATGLIELPTDDRLLAEEFLVQILAADPDRSVSGKWLYEVCKPALDSETRFPSRTSDLEMAFRCWEAVGLVGQQRGALSESRGLEEIPDVRLADQLLAAAPEIAPTDSRQKVVQILQRNWLIRIWCRLAICPRNQAAVAASTIEPLAKLSESSLDREVRGVLLRNAVTHLMKLDSGNWRILQSHVSEVLRSGPGNDWEFWINLSRNSEDTAFQDWLGAEILGANGRAPTGASHTEIKSAVDGLRRSMLNAKYGAVFKMNDEAAASAQVVKNRLSVASKSDPRLIAQTVEAANQALRAIRQIQRRSPADDAPPLQTFALADIDSAFDRLSTSTSTVEIGTDIPTASDFRTLRQTITLIADSSESNREFRKTALEKLSQVSARLEDLSSADAEILARYYLSSKAVDEWLVAEQCLPQFRHWPTFRLAVFDRLESTDAELDQALTLGQILAGRTISIDDGEQWREIVRSDLFETIAIDLQRNHLLDLDGSTRAWNTLQQVLEKLYFQRAELLGVAQVADEFGSGCLRQAQRLGQFSGDFESEINLTRLKSWLKTELSSDLEQTVTWVQVFADLEFARQAFAYPALRDQFSRLKTEHSGRVASAKSLAELLFAHEYSLLLLWDAIREYEVSQLIEGPSP